MGAIASKGQLRMSLLRWLLVTAPLLLLLGFASGRSAPAGAASAWYDGLAKPAATPPDWLFPIAWTILYLLMATALAIVLNARGARWRWPAVALFALGFALALAWTPAFFGAHRIGLALEIGVGMVFVGIATTLAFGRVRTLAAWLMLPYLVWISFAAVLTWRIGQMNPEGGTVAPGPHTTQIIG